MDSGRLVYCTADISRYDQVEDAVRKAVKEIGDIDILVNNAGLALGAPNRFPDLKVEDIVQMSRTNIDGYMFAAYAALNVGGMKNRKRGIILNVTSVTGLEGEYLGSAMMRPRRSTTLRQNVVVGQYWGVPCKQTLMRCDCSSSFPR